MDDTACGYYDVDARRIGLPTRIAAAPSEAMAQTPQLIALHEAAHVHEFIHGQERLHLDPDFLRARSIDHSARHICPFYDAHFRDIGDSDGGDPRQETWANSLAMYLLGDRRWPKLYEYWEPRLRSGPPPRSACTAPLEKTAPAP